MPRASFAAALTPGSCAFSREGERTLIAFEQVAKTYRSAFGRRVEAVADVSFTIAPGEVVGIAGPNGAGKSTLIALMLGLLSPTSGRVTLDGRAPRDFAEWEGIGYLPELVTLDPAWRADEALARLGMLAGVPAATLRAQVDDVIGRVGLSEHRRKRCRQLSKGNLQKVALAQSLLADRQVYVFDEPTHGLDPVWTLQFRKIIAELRRPDRAMLVASHNLDELERISDRVVIIDHGRIQRIVDLKARVASVEVSTYRVRAVAGADALVAEFPGAVETEPGNVLIPALELGALNRGLARAIAGGAIIAVVQPVQSALEREFHAAVGGPGGLA